MKQWIRTGTAFCWFALALPAWVGADSVWKFDTLCAAPETRPADGFQEDGVTALFYDGPAYRGKPTHVFAWYGAPKMDANTRLPGMVLVHGGGGTAFAEWVRLWTARGYAAIAMDTCGCVPRGKYGDWE